MRCLSRLLSERGLNVCPQALGRSHFVLRQLVVQLFGPLVLFHVSWLFKYSLICFASILLARKKIDDEVLSLMPISWAILR